MRRCDRQSRGKSAICAVDHRKNLNGSLTWADAPSSSPLRWRCVSLGEGHLTVDEAVYDGAFGTAKASAGVCPVPLTDRRTDEEWKPRHSL